MRRCFFILSLLFCLGYGAVAQHAAQLIRQANDLYRQQLYDQAANLYQQALDLEPANATAAFNRANALYRQSLAADAIRELDELALRTTDPELKAKAYYNKGAILSAAKKTEESIEAYKNALRNNPADTQARENLQKALLELKKKTPPPPPKEDRKKQQQQQKQQQPQMNRKEAQQRLKLLEQKEKDVQQRMQLEKAKTGTGQQKDW
ncbi:MAG: tetratricopeptide repeat protein [Chitinophagaceae bacterium]